MSTTESKPRTAASVAWGTVAFESSYQRTPVGLADELDAVRQPVEVAQRVVHAVETGAGGNRGGRGGQRVADVVGHGSPELARPR